MFNSTDNFLCRFSSLLSIIQVLIFIEDFLGKNWYLRVEKNKLGSLTIQRYCSAENFSVQ